MQNSHSLISALRAIWPRMAVGLLFVGLCLGVVLTAWPKAQPVALVGQVGWRAEGQFAQLSPQQVSGVEVPTTILRDKQLTVWRSLSAKAEKLPSTLTSAPFKLSRFVAVPFHGFPGEQPGNSIVLRCLTTNASIDVTTLRTNTQWATAYLRIPSDFCPGEAELVATAGPRYYVGVGTPFAIDAATYYAQQSVFPKLCVVVATWSILCSLIFVAGYSANRLLNADMPTAGFVTTGVAGMLVFIVFHFSPRWGVFVVWVLVFASFCAQIVIWFSDRARVMRMVRRIAPAALIWLAVSISYAAYIGTIDNGGGSWAVNGLFRPLRWSTDNQIPFQSRCSYHHSTYPSWKCPPNPSKPRCRGSLHEVAASSVLS